GRGGGGPGQSLSAPVAKRRVILSEFTAFGTRDHAPLASSKLQYSTAQNHLVAIFELVELITPKFAPSCNESSVHTTQIANKEILAAADNLRVPARHAIHAPLNRGKVHIHDIRRALRAPNHVGVGLEAKFRFVTPYDPPGRALRRFRASRIPEKRCGRRPPAAPRRRW